jgi:hypothetical protein
LRFKLQGVKELKKAFKQARQRAEASLALGLFLEAESIMRASKREVPVDEGILRASGFVKRPTIRRGRIQVVLGYGGAAKAYALFIHEGTGPAVGRSTFSPPVEVFRDWARRVLGDESLGFVIARSVGQKGLKPRKFLERPLRRKLTGMGRRLAIRVRKDVERGK